MKKEYVVSFTDSMQISFEDWIPVERTLKVTGDTTISEIEEFYRKYDKVEVTRFRINELETLKP